MDQLALLQPESFLVFTLVLARVSGLVMVAPVIGGKALPLRVRALLSLSLSLVLWPRGWQSPLTDQASLIDYGLLIGRELAVGLTLGLGVIVILGGVQLAGQLISQISGIALADVFNPAFDANVPVFSEFLTWCTLAAFVCLGGPTQVLAALLETFATLPPGTELVSPTLLDTINTLVTQSIELGLRIAAPAVTAQLLATLVLGLVSRTLPQLNILALGFGLNSLATFGALWFSLGAMVWAFQDELEPMLASLVNVLRTVN